MIRHRIKTNDQPQKILITVAVDKPCRVKITGSDSLHKNSVYFNLVKTVTNTHTFEGDLPIAPRQLKVAITTSGEGKVTMVTYKSAPCNEKDWMKDLDPSLTNFIQFAAWFAKHAGYIRAEHIYKSKSGKYVIYYRDVIRDYNTNAELATPARIGRETGRIEISAKVFRTYSIPMRMFIFLHEIMHRYLNTRSEFVADENARMLYEGLSFPRVEAVYSFTRVFDHDNATPEQRKRAQLMISEMKRFKMQEINSTTL